MNPLMETRDLAVHFGAARALDGVSLEWRRGEVLGIVGESGCGKSTLARALLGLVPAAGGSVLADGTELGGKASLRAVRRTVQMIFQDPYQTLNPRRRVRDVVAEPLVVTGVAKAEHAARVERALEEVGLAPARFCDRYPHQLSGGQRQRVAIAATLVLEPAGIVCDEPVSMLDVSVRSQILHVLLELQRARELALLFITHDLSLAWQLCDRIAVMYLGRIVEQGDARDVIERPGHPYTQALVEAVPPRKQRTALAGELPDAANLPSGCRFHPRCPKRFDACDQVDPELYPAGEPTHEAACLLLGSRLTCYLFPGLPTNLVGYAWSRPTPLWSAPRNEPIPLAARRAADVRADGRDRLRRRVRLDLRQLRRPTRARSSLSLVAYSTPEVVYDEIEPEFQKTGAGEGVGFKSSFGASGEQSRAVEAGLKADVVSFSLEPDMTRLVDAGLVAKDWANTPSKGLVTTSVVSFIVRKGNPKHIKTWDDLLKPGVQVLTPNPFTSGAAKWNLLGAYGAKSDGGKNPQAGLAYLKELITKHVKVQDKSGRDALNTFTSGTGDVLLSYEYEATTAQKKGQDVDFVTPPDTIKIENPIAVTKSAAPAAKKFVDFVLSKQGQEKFASWGYRPVNQEVFDANKSKFPEPKQLFTIRDLGGWTKVNDEMFDPEKGSVAKIEEDAGVSTAS